MPLRQKEECKCLNKILFNDSEYKKLLSEMEKLRKLGVKIIIVENKAFIDVKLGDVKSYRKGGGKEMVDLILTLTLRYSGSTMYYLLLLVECKNMHDYQRI